MDDKDLLLHLQDIYSRALLIPVVGSGISIPFGLPDWKTLIIMAAENFGLDNTEKVMINNLLDKYKFLEAIDIILNSGVSEYEIQQFVSETIKDAKNNCNSKVESNYEDLKKMRRLRFITTNYDRYINDIVDADTFLLNELAGMNVNEFALRKYDSCVIPLHGDIDRPDSIIFTRKSYDDLYDSDEFDREFQHIRTHFTFLFMGFSFDDVYFQRMFEKIVNRFEAKHYILFDINVKKFYPEKIDKLIDTFGVEPIFYDSSKQGHTKAISDYLCRVFNLSDPNVDTSELEKLSEVSTNIMSTNEQKIIDEGRELIRKENVTRLFELYNKEYNEADFRTHSVEYQIEIINGLSWYYGFIRQNDSNAKLFEFELKNTDIYKQKRKLVIMYAQVLWNLRDYDKCLEILESYDGEKNIIIGFLLDIVKCFKKFLPDRSEVSGDIPVYSDKERSPEEDKLYKDEYLKLKGKYINGETYNLLNLRKYEDITIQHIIYYFMGITAGQLFHEHGEAIQYLNRAFELNQSIIVCEELAYNYLGLAENKTRYKNNAKTYDIDMNSLLKAKIHFQYVMNYNDETAKNSFFERSGYAYLRTLFLLKDYYDFEIFYSEAESYINKDYDFMRMKATVDAYYNQMMDNTIVSQLSDNDRLYIEFLCADVRADLFSKFNKHEEYRIRRSILDWAEAEGHPISNKKIVEIVIDNTLLLKDVVYYKRIKQLYSKEIFSDVEELGFEDELYGDLTSAKEKFVRAWDKHKDYQGTFNIIKGFYIRNRLKDEFDSLYKSVIENPLDTIYTTPKFFMQYIISEGSDWGDSWHAMELYEEYYEIIKEDIVCRKELEEMLKLQVADYCNYEERVDWNRHMLTNASPMAKSEMYMSILKLFVANCQYRKAEEILKEMKNMGIVLLTDFDNLINVCIKKQPRKYYVSYKPYYLADKDYLDIIERKLMFNFRFGQEFFGAKGGEILISIEKLLIIFRRNRKKELESLSKIYIMYAGIINLQSSLWAGESPFLRMVLQWIGTADNVVMTAPDFLDVCKYAPKHHNKEHSAETIQMELFSKEHPEVVTV